MLVTTLMVDLQRESRFCGTAHPDRPVALWMAGRCSFGVGRR
jgi:hypothetical protein